MDLLVPTSRSLPALRPVAAAAADLAGLVWPVSCAGCAAPDTPLCDACLARFGAARRIAVPAWHDGPGAWVTAGYRGPPGRVVVAWKERGRHDLTRRLGRVLARCVLAAAQEVGSADGWGWDGAWDAAWDRVGDRDDGGGRDGADGCGVLLIPVPTRTANRRARGADLTLDLARAARRAVSRSDPVGPAPAVGVVRALRYARRVHDQAGLDAEERRANLAGAFEPRPRLRAALAGRAVVVVDDVVTTGTTLAEAARVLTSEGAQVVGACCLCVTERRHRVSGSGSLD